MQPCGCRKWGQAPFHEMLRNIRVRARMGRATATFLVMVPDPMLSNLLLLAAALTSPAPQVTQQAYAKASNTGSQDNFAGAVAISGNTLVVGSTFEDSAAAGVNGDQSSNASANAGAAYVFIRNGVSWSQQAYLKASNPETNDSFGQAVAISGDTIVIGAPREDSASPG